MPKKKKQFRARPVGLNLILWFSFLLFAVVIIVFFSGVLTVQTNRRYRNRVATDLCEAAQELKDSIVANKGKPSPSAVAKDMLNIANRYGVSAYLFSVNGKMVYPSDSEPSEAEAEYIAGIFDKVSLQFENSEHKDAEWQESVTDREAWRATVINLWGMDHYLYVASSFETINRISNDMIWFSVFSALFAVALSFVVSGFVSMIITKPVSEVTAKAKELARGNYDVSFGDGNFCAEVNDLSKALNHASSEISKADKMQKELIANVSHDFKTPLTMIKAYASMIREISGDDPQKRDKHTQIIVEETDRLAALVDDVLDLSRLQAGIDDAERTVFNLSEDVWRVTGRFGYLTETQGYTLETDIDDDLYTCAGRARVEQVLYNLIGNAFNYSGDGKKVVVRLKKQQGGARFEVTDSGKGIPKEELDTIWERYYRSREAHKRPVNGTGLGLSIVKAALIRYNFPFGVESEVGKGSCFWVFFPDPPEETP